ncbi:MAG TPA: sodium ion-translocating decarboxylase subunit beta, partial [bacterium]|nr:sodium ion-translocating decarboxylase subunit beta [bacterium]
MIMILVGIVLVYLAIDKKFEPLLLLPIGFGIIVGNIPFAKGMEIGIYEEGSVLNYLYQGVIKGIYPPIIFLGIGAMTDFSAMLSKPRLILLGAAAQLGIFLAFIGAIVLGFSIKEAGAIGIIGGADGPTAIFLTSKLAPHFIGPIAITAYSYMALIPIIQPPIMRLLTTKKERMIKMPPPRVVSKLEKIIFP